MILNLLAFFGASAGKTTMNVVNAVTQFERDLPSAKREMAPVPIDSF